MGLRGRVLVAKVGLDGHDRGAKMVSRALRDAGYEVIYTGLRQTPETITAVAVQEDVDMVGLSILSGAHGTLIPDVTRLLAEAGCDMPVVVGGIIPPSDVSALAACGVAAVFGPGEPMAEIITEVGRLVSDYRKSQGLP